MTPHFGYTGMDKKPLYLWCAYPDDLLIAGVAEASVALLSEEERARVQRFRFERHQRESLATRALVRTALSYVNPLPPQSWQFKLNAHGKPAIELATSPDRGLHFNLSNSLGLVVCLVAEGAEVGVDVEPFERADQILKLAPEVFSAAEQAQLEALHGAEKLDRALSLWTLKESYIKARGMGLSLALDKFSFLFGGAEGVRLEIDASLSDTAQRWRFCLFDHAGHRIAAMVECAGAGELELLEARPIVAPPIRVSKGNMQWFPLV
jgi:4'-phosphopantetheinyl transferase